MARGRFGCAVRETQPLETRVAPFLLLCHTPQAPVSGFYYVVTLLLLLSPGAAFMFDTLLAHATAFTCIARVVLSRNLLQRTTTTSVRGRWVGLKTTGGSVVG